MTKTIIDVEEELNKRRKEGARKKISEETQNLAKEIHEVIFKYEDMSLSTAVGALEVVKWIMIRDCSQGELND